MTTEKENRDKEQRRFEEEESAARDLFMEELRKKLMYEYEKQDKMEQRFEEFRVKSDQ